MDKLRILLVDDDEVDYMNVRRAFKKNQMQHELVHKINGAEAFEHLETLSASELPDIILLDINMPKMNGHEFLMKIRGDKKYCSILVYVVTTSNQKSDIVKAYNGGIAGYFVKPLDFEEFKNTIKLLNDLWAAQVFPTVQ